MLIKATSVPQVETKDQNALVRGHQNAQVARVLEFVTGSEFTKDIKRSSGRVSRFDNVFGYDYKPLDNALKENPVLALKLASLLIALNRRIVRNKHPSVDIDVDSYLDIDTRKIFGEALTNSIEDGKVNFEKLMENLINFLYPPLTEEEIKEAERVVEEGINVLDQRYFLIVGGERIGVKEYFSSAKQSKTEERKREEEPTVEPTTPTREREEQITPEVKDQSTRTKEDRQEPKEEISQSQTIPEAQSGVERSEEAERSGTQELNVLQTQGENKVKSEAESGSQVRSGEVGSVEVTGQAMEIEGEVEKSGENQKNVEEEREIELRSQLDIGNVELLEAFPPSILPTATVEQIRERFREELEELARNYQEEVEPTTPTREREEQITPEVKDQSTRTKEEISQSQPIPEAQSGVERSEEAERSGTQELNVLQTQGENKVKSEAESGSQVRSGEVGSVEVTGQAMEIEGEVEKSGENQKNVEEEREIELRSQLDIGNVELLEAFPPSILPTATVEQIRERAREKLEELARNYQEERELKWGEDFGETPLQKKTKEVISSTPFLLLIEDIENGEIIREEPNRNVVINRDAVFSFEIKTASLNEGEENEIDRKIIERIKENLRQNPNFQQLGEAELEKRAREIYDYSKETPMFKTFPPSIIKIRANGEELTTITTTLFLNSFWESIRNIKNIDEIDEIDRFKTQIRQRDARRLARLLSLTSSFLRGEDIPKVFSFEQTNEMIRMLGEIARQGKLIKFIEGLYLLEKFQYNRISALVNLEGEQVEIFDKRYKFRKLVYDFKNIFSPESEEIEERDYITEEDRDNAKALFLYTALFYQNNILKGGEDVYVPNLNVFVNLFERKVENINFENLQINIQPFIRERASTDVVISRYLAAEHLEKIIRIDISIVFKRFEKLRERLEK